MALATTWRYGRDDLIAGITPRSSALLSGHSLITAPLCGVFTLSLITQASHFHR